MTSLSFMMFSSTCCGTAQSLILCFSGDPLVFHPPLDQKLLVTEKSSLSYLNSQKIAGSDGGKKAGLEDKNK